MPTYKVALKLTAGDGLLAAYVGAVASGTLTVRVAGGVSRITGSVDRVTRAGKPISLPVKLPVTFKDEAAGTLMQGASGAVTIPSRIGSVSVTWGTVSATRVDVAAVVQASGVAALMFTSARFEGAAKPIAEAAVPSAPEAPVTPAPTVPSGGAYPTHPRDVIGVGMDYVWPLEDHDRLCRELKAAGCTATGIELMGGWSRRAGAADAWKYGIQREAWASMLAACRRHRILLFVSIFNSNKGLGKYGDDKKPGSRYDALVREYMAMVMADGPEGVWVQPVSETQPSDYDGDYAGKIEREFIAKFNKAGFVTVYNNGSRPSRPGAGAKFHAHHVFTLSDTGSANALVNTDTGTAITSLTNGGIYGATLKPAACAGFVRKVVATGNRGALVYSFTGLTGIPSDAIKAVGAERRAR